MNLSFLIKQKYIQMQNVVSNCCALLYILLALYCTKECIICIHSENLILSLLIRTYILIRNQNTIEMMGGGGIKVLLCSSQ